MSTNIELPAGMQKDVSLSKKNTLAVPSVADYFISVSDVHTVRAVIDWAKYNHHTLAILAGGSNVLLDSKINSVVIQPNFIGKDITSSDAKYSYLRVGAGEQWHSFTQWTLNQGMYGLENLSLIPGSVGAAPIQNIGAYGTEVSTFVESVETIDLLTGEMEILLGKDCDFAYRDSFFKSGGGRNKLITHVNFRLLNTPNLKLNYPALTQYFSSDTAPSSAELANAVIEIRKSKLPSPSVIPNVGSFFKNPVINVALFNQINKMYAELPYFTLSDGNIKIPAAWLIDTAGWKEKSKTRNVKVHTDQPLVVINPNHLTLDTILALASDIQKDIFQLFQIQLEIEPQRLRAIQLGPQG